MHPEHLVMVSFDYGLENLDALNSLSTRLDTILKKEAAGMPDRNEMATDLSDGLLFMYGHNAEILFRIIPPALMKTPFMAGATATLRFGPVGEDTPEITVDL